MRKTTLHAVISTSIIMFFFWLILTGQIVSIFRGLINWQTIVIGVAISIGVSLFSAKFFIHEKPYYLFNPKKLFNLLGYCFGPFMVELTKANIDVAIRALSPKLNVNPGIVKVPVSLKSDYGNSMLANSITLTPGTITLDIVEQEGKYFYYIHWIDVKTTDHEQAGEMIKGTLEKWIGRVFE